MFLALVMIASGVAIAIAVMASIGIAQRLADRPAQPAGRDHVAASILFNLLLAGGDRSDEALRDIRKVAGLGSPVTPSIDIASWSGRFAQNSNADQRAWLLETAVRLAASRGKPLPLAQYTVLLDLSFGLGFQTDALAKLRDRYPFEYVDHAKNARPREADRGGGSLSMFARGATDTAPLLRTLGLEGKATRQAIISAYRRLAAQHHPDRFYGEAPEVQSASAAKFIEITRAYESLLAIYPEEP